MVYYLPQPLQKMGSFKSLPLWGARWGATKATKRSATSNTIMYLALILQLLHKYNSILERYNVF